MNVLMEKTGTKNSITNQNNNIKNRTKNKRKKS